MSKPLSLRQEQVLQATVHHYVDTMEPVGSRTLVQRFGIPASSATVRSAMGALERRGLLRLGDQAHQAGEIRQPPCHMHQQVVQTGPTKTESGELPFQVLNGDAGFRQQRIHVVPVSHRAGNASG